MSYGLRELKVGNCSIIFDTDEGVHFNIETRKGHGMAVYMNDKKIFSRNVKGKNDLKKAVQ